MTDQNTAGKLLTDQDTIGKLLEGSPYWSHLGIKIRRMEPGFAELALPFKKELGQIFRLMHGGAIASLVDAAGGMAMLTKLDLDQEMMSTAEMKINYLNPVTRDQAEIVASARVIKKGKALGVSMVEIKNGVGTLVAIGIATFAFFPRSQPCSVK